LTHDTETYPLRKKHRAQFLTNTMLNDEIEKKYIHGEPFLIIVECAIIMNPVVSH
jgi:hypothetical protein